MTLARDERAAAGAFEGAAMHRALDRAAGARAIPGNTVEHLPGGPQALAAMRKMIQAAERWIHFENYIIRDDETGQTFAGDLIEAARRGVKVRVLYDAFGCRWTGPGYWRRLRHEGVEVRAFNQVNPVRPFRSMRRDHRKYLGVDNSRAIVGGLCIGNEWAGDEERHRPPWRDTAAEIRGPAVTALDQTFHPVWRIARGRGTMPILEPSAPANGLASVRVIDGVPGSSRIYRTIQWLAATVAERLWITEAYFWAPPTLVAALVAAAKDGVDVRLLVPGSTDAPPVRAFTRVGYRELLRAGVRIWEWSGPMLHAKTVLADGYWYKVGSSNLNTSSLRHNHELDILAEDATIARAAAGQFRLDLAKANEIVLRQPRWAPQRWARRLPQTPRRSGGRVALGRAGLSPSERGHRAFITLRQVALGARRSIAGAALFASIGAGILLVSLPRVTAYVLALGCFWFGFRAAREFWRRQRSWDE